MMLSKDFYNKQNEWSNIYYRPVGEGEFERIRFIRSLTHPKGKKMLELGCGGGQFAIAASKVGYQVTALDVNADFIKFARSQSKDIPESNLKFIVTDFFQEFDLGQFDFICYWDGFGIGSDSQQKILLQKMIGMLKPNGVILLEIFTPWFWSSAAVGQSWKVSNATRKYDFDAYGNRLFDYWWETGNESSRIYQSIRCYAPVDLELLLGDTGCDIKQIKPGGAIDYSTGEYSPTVSLVKAMTYIAVISAKKSLSEK